MAMVAGWTAVAAVAAAAQMDALQTQEVRVEPEARVEVAPSAVVSWGELLARDAALRAAGVSLREADGGERAKEKIGPKELRIGPDGQVQMLPLDLTKPVVDPEAAPKEVDPDALRFAAEGASAPATRMTTGLGLANLDLQQSFTAIIDNNTSIPPDTMGAIGPQHLMTMLNTQTRIQSRDGMSVSFMDTDTFWSPIAFGVFDPRIFYDELAGRWVAAAVHNAFNPGSALLLAVSETSDPTGNWRFFRIDADATNVDWADFPDAGYNNKWIALTANMFSITSGQFSGAKMWVIEKSSVTSPFDPIVVHVFPTGFDLAGGVTSFSLRPAHTHDAAEDALYIVDLPGSSGGTPFIRVSRVLGVVSSPAWSALPNPAPFAGSGAYASPVLFNLGFPDAAQQGSPTGVDSGDSRMLDAEFRNGRLWATNAGGLPFGGASDRTASAWYEIDPTNVASPFVQGGLIAGASNEHFFYPSIAVNRNDDVLIGFSHSSPSLFVEAGYAGRLKTDPLGTTRAPVVFQVGKDSYVKTFSGSRNRWGDYSQTSVDPKDDRTFWTIQEYAEAGAPSFDRWGTRWAQVGFVECPEDIDGDGSVGPSDLFGMLANWGTFFGPSDLFGLLANWAAVCPTQTPGP